MATTQDDFHEIQLNGKQLVFLFMAVTVVSVVIFLCGVLVGRGVQGEGTLAATADAVDGVTEGVPPPPASTGGTSSAPGTAGETLSYAERLTKAVPVNESLRKADSAPPPPATPPPSAPTSAAPATSAATPPPPAPKASTPAAPTEPVGAGFAIQVAALRERTEADAVANRLIGKGYKAYVMPPPAGAPAVYRVRVGKFKEKREADTVAARLQKEEQFKPWIVR